jgi:uncharacterized protein (TIGR03437 family)
VKQLLAGLGVCCMSLAAQTTAPQAARPQYTLPVITSVVSSASGQPGVVSGSWITIYGTGLSNTTRAWQASDFVNGQLPPQMDYISVKVNARSAYIAYLSPTQLNVLVPDDPTLGSVPVQAYGQLLQSNFFYVNKVALQPAIFPFPATKYAAAVHNSSGIYAGPPGLLDGVTTTPAQPGEVIQIFGTGFGVSNPPIPTGQLFSAAAPLAGEVTAAVGNVAADVTGYLVAPGVYQFNVTVPSVPDGDQTLVITTDGLTTQSGLWLTIANQLGSGN